MENTFYAVQRCVDGFGHDTSTVICFKTREECKTWIKENTVRYTKNLGMDPCFAIVEQKFGEYFEEIWD